MKKVYDFSLIAIGAIMFIVLMLLAFGSMAQSPTTEIRRGTWQLFVINDTNRVKVPVNDSTWMLTPDTVLINHYIHDTIYITAPTIPASFTTIFTTQTLPITVTNDGDGGITLGTKFYSSLAGFIKGIRFYKVAGNSGTHIAQLYSSTGTLLWSVPFSGETVSGWQTVSFSTSVPIVPGTIYIAACYSPTGAYSSTDTGFSVPITNSPLTGVSGIYKKGDVPAFPVSVYKTSNYFVDVLYSPTK